MRHARCADQLECPCRGDEAIHSAQAAARQLTATLRAVDAVGCPECGASTTPRQLSMWGHCRVCRTADSRAVQPLRW